jgi:hypothetical protein
MFAHGASIVPAVAALLFAASAWAQNPPAAPPALASDCVAESRQPPCLSIPTGPTLERPTDARSGDAAGTFTLFGRVKGFALWQTDTARTTVSFGPTWRLKTGIRFDAPGDVQFSASVSARRGYSLPIAMGQPLGSDAQSIEQDNLPVQSSAAPIHWDTELRIRKKLISSEPLDLSVVGEAFNLLNLNRKSEPTATTPVLTSPTVRAGVLLGF